VENGVEKIKIDDIESSKNKDVVNILFLSNLFESKGVFVALEAFRLLPLEKENVVLHLVGGMSSKEMEEKINKIIAKNNLPVIIHGALFGDKKYKILEIADIFIHPTLNDAFPLVLLEAMQFKLPIMSTYQGAIPDIIDDGQTGFLVKENDAVVLSEKILYLVNNRIERKNMGAKAYEKYLERYTLQIFENNMSEMFDKYLN